MNGLPEMYDEADAPRMPSRDDYTADDEHPLAYLDIGVRQSLNTAYTAHKELAGFYKSELAKALTPQQMQTVEKYAHCEVKAAGSQFLIEKFL